VSNPSTVIIALGASTAGGIATSQAVAGAGNLTLNGSLVTSGVAQMDVARRVLIASAGADSAIVFTVYGTDRNGNTQSETVTGVASGSSQYTKLDYITVTRIAVSGATAGNITVSTNGVGSSDWVVDDFLATTWELAGGISVASGTATYTLEYTYDDPNKTGTSLVVSPSQWSMEPASYVPALVWPYATIIGAGGNNEFAFPNKPIFAHRVTVNSGTGTVVMQSIQSGAPVY